MRALTLLLLAAPTFAHEGHGPEGPHMHGWDGLGTLALVVAAGVALWWFSKGRK